MWSIEDIHLASAWVQPTVDTILPGKPQHPIIVEGGGVQVCSRAIRWQRKDGHLESFWGDAHDGVQPAVGDPRCPVGAHNHAMGSGTGTERRMSGLSSFRIEPPKFARTLCGVPDPTVEGGRYIVGTGPRWDRVCL